MSIWLSTTVLALLLLSLPTPHKANAATAAMSGNTSITVEFHPTSLGTVAADGEGRCHPGEEDPVEMEMMEPAATAAAAASSRRMLVLQQQQQQALPSRLYISYAALRADVVPCSRPGVPYYNCLLPARANAYHRGCGTITRCARFDYP